MKHKLITINLLVLSIFSSCKKDNAAPNDPTIDCSTTQNRDIEAFFDTIHSHPNYELYDDMDFTSHEYSFTVTGDIQICGLAYKSQGNNFIYTMELLNASGTSLYTANLTFSNAVFDYVSIPPIILNAGHYVMRRTITNNTTATETVGPITRGTGGIPLSNSDFPINLGLNITIDSTRFFGNGTSVSNYGVPNIYFEYHQL